MPRRILLLCAIVAAVVLGLKLGKDRTEPPAEATHVEATPEQVLTTSTPVAATATPSGKMTIESIFDLLRRREITPAQLLAFRDALLKGDPAVVIPAIRAFLETGEDTTTGLAFELGAGGNLDKPSTFRLLLLDVLGRLSRQANTRDAAVVSRQILEQKTSADEWAISMRNVAWQEPQSRAYLAQKFKEMLKHDPWRTQPTPGFLEAFDAAVYSKQVTVMESLEEELNSPMPDAKRAAAVALDRLAEAAPLDVMQKLNSQPQLFADRPYLRADWFAKADLSDVAQRAAFEMYLARQDVSLSEKDKALRSLVSPGQFLSDNLITPPPAPADDAARDAVISAAANDWVKRFPDLTGPLSTLREHLGQ